MLDRQDIDALLVGALYGELTPAEEARLTQHLDSHPADRVALDDLTRARTAVRDSRIFAFQVEPPQAVSAILLQEAHRRAPKVSRVVAEERSEGWFQRFVRSFMAHPAMAAAAMLVLVAGVAGTMYARHGVKAVDETVTTRSADAPAAGSSQVAAAERADKAPVIAGEKRMQDQFDAQLDESTLSKGDLQQKPADIVVDGTGKANAKNQIAAPNEAKVDPAKTPPPPTGITVYHSTPQPKDLDDSNGYRAEKKKLGKQIAFEENELSGGEGDGGGAAVNNTNQTVSPKAPDNGVSNGPAVRDGKDEKQREVTKETSDASLLKWATDQHARLKQLVVDGNCKEAAKVAVALQNRAPDYYAQKVADDRDIKQCGAYIQLEREKDAERSGKSRAKRVNADEPSPAPPPSTTNK